MSSESRGFLWKSWSIHGLLVLLTMLILHSIFRIQQLKKELRSFQLNSQYVEIELNTRSETIPTIETTSLILTTTEESEEPFNFIKNNSWSIGPTYLFQLKRTAREKISLKHKNFRSLTSLDQIPKLTSLNDIHQIHGLQIIVNPDCSFSSNDLTLTIYVKTSFSNGFHRRSVIRQFLSNVEDSQIPLKVRIMFVVMIESENEFNQIPNEQPIKQEIRQYNDLLVVSGKPDSWQYLSYKIIGIFMHAKMCFDLINQNKINNNKTLASNNFLLLTDDDVTIFVENIFNYLILPIRREQKSINRNYMIGRICWTVPPIRTPPGNGRGRYYISNKSYPFKVYPPFSAGMGTFLTFQTIPLIFRQIYRVPMQLGQLDDTYLGLLVFFHNQELREKTVQNGKIDKDDKDLKKKLENNPNFIKVVKDRRFSEAYFRNGTKWYCQAFNLHRRINDTELMARRKKMCGEGNVYFY